VNGVRRAYLRRVDSWIEVPEHRLRAAAWNDPLVDRMIDGMRGANRRSINAGLLIVLSMLGLIFLPIPPHWVRESRASCSSP
jgi:hypothetical protein